MPRSGNHHPKPIPMSQNVSIHQFLPQTCRTISATVWMFSFDKNETYTAWKNHRWLRWWWLQSRRLGDDDDHCPSEDHRWWTPFLLFQGLYVKGSNSKCLPPTWNLDHQLGVSGIEFSWGWHLHLAPSVRSANFSISSKSKKSWKVQKCCTEVRLIYV